MCMISLQMGYSTVKFLDVGRSGFSARKTSQSSQLRTSNSYRTTGQYRGCAQYTS